jgi:hypothetical protein
VRTIMIAEGQANGSRATIYTYMPVVLAGISLQVKHHRGRIPRQQPGNRILGEANQPEVPSVSPPRNGELGQADGDLAEVLERISRGLVIQGVREGVASRHGVGSRPLIQLMVLAHLQKRRSWIPLQKGVLGFLSPCLCQLGDRVRDLEPGEPCHIPGRSW